MSGPTTGYPSLPAVQAEAEGEGGDIENGDVVWVIDIQQFVRVYNAPGLDVVIILRNFYPSEDDYEEDTDEGYVPDWTPGVIVNEAVPYKPVITSGCTGGLLPLPVAYPKIKAGSSGVKYTIGAAAATVITSPDLATGADTSDIP